MAVLSEVSFLSFCQPRETGQGASSSHNPQSSVSDCGKRALKANIKKTQKNPKPKPNQSPPPPPEFRYNFQGPEDCQILNWNQDRNDCHRPNSFLL